MLTYLTRSDSDTSLDKATTIVLLTRYSFSHFGIVCEHINVCWSDCNHLLCVKISKHALIRSCVMNAIQVENHPSNFNLPTFPTRHLGWTEIYLQYHSQQLSKTVHRQFPQCQSSMCGILHMIDRGIPDTVLARGHPNTPAVVQCS